MDRAPCRPELLHFNGIDATTGRYLFDPCTEDELAARVRAEVEAAMPPSRRMRSGGPRFGGGGLAAGVRQVRFRGLPEGVDEKNLAEAGWGALFPNPTDGAILDALGPLLALREEQATAAGEPLFHLFARESGYPADIPVEEYLMLLGVAPGAVPPETFPFYLMVVGSPEEIPFDVERQLGQHYAVGRLDLESPAAYRSYAETVVAAEAGKLPPRRTVAFFAPDDDPATEQSRCHLVEPLAAGTPRWRPEEEGFERVAALGPAASHARLGRLLGGGDTPGLLFTASHGVSFPRGEPRQRESQGALLCGGSWRPGRPPAREEIFQADDVAAGADVAGLVHLAFGCYTAGTPGHDSYGHRDDTEPPRALAERPFVARLPQRLLGHPHGGALACVGHLDRAWSASYWWPGMGRQVGTFESVLQALTAGQPLGAALRHLRTRRSEIGERLIHERDRLDTPRSLRRGTAAPRDPRHLTFLWTAHQDARDYALLGDPAVRLPGAAAPESPVAEPAVAGPPAARRAPAPVEARQAPDEGPWWASLWRRWTGRG